MEKDSPCKWKPKEVAVTVVISDKNKLKGKNCNNRQRKSLYNDESIN